MPLNAGHRFLRDPLAHFLLAGAVLFATVTMLGGAASEEEQGDSIQVDRQALLAFMQYRANAFQPDLFERALDAMPQAELDALVDDFLDEEVLYREAKALGLDQSDYIIRQRLVQKLRFLMGDLSAAERPEPGALEAWFQENREAYAVAPSVTFTHVYFDAGKRGADQARLDAEEALAGLRQQGAGFHDAMELGDRFPYLRHYVDRTLDYVGDHFGAEFAARLGELEASGSQWRGPLASAFGQHLVLLTESRPPRLPELEEVLEEVERDWRAEQSEARLAQMARSLRERYQIDLAPLRRPAEQDSEGPGAETP